MHRGMVLLPRLHKKIEDLYSSRNKQRKDEKDSGARLENKCECAADVEKLTTVRKTITYQNLP